MSSHVRYEVADRVATITLDRPEKRNAMSYAMLGDFIETVERAGADPAAHVVILTGSGGSFCAGTDLAFLAGSPLSHRLIKELVYAGFERGVHEHMSHHRQSLTTCFRSADHREGVASFLERRPARFSGA